MKESTRNFWVGLFVILSFGALALLMVWFGETPTWLGSSEWTLRIAGVRELRGVGEGSAVSLNGVDIGRVFRLEFENPARPDQGVVIVTRIKKQYRVPRGAMARIYGATLGIGSGRIEIVLLPGHSTEPLAMEPQDRPTIPGEMRSIIGEIVNKELVDSLQRTIDHIGNLTAAWTPVGTNLADLLNRRTIEEVGRPGVDLQPNFTTVIERIDALVAHLNAVLGDVNVQGDIKSVVRDLKASAESMRETVTLWKTESQKIADNVNSGIDRTEANLDRSFAGINQVFEMLDDASTSLAVVLQQVEQGKGTAGLLVRDERLYESAVLALERFTETVSTFNRILGKVEQDGYVTVSLGPSGLLKPRYPIPKTATPATATQNP